MFGSLGVLIVTLGSVIGLVTIAAGARCIVENRADLALGNDPVGTWIFVRRFFDINGNKQAGAAEDDANRNKAGDLVVMYLAFCHRSCGCSYADPMRAANDLPNSHLADATNPGCTPTNTRMTLVSNKA